MEIAIAMVGLGGLGHLQAEAYAEMDGVTVVAGVDVSEEARKVFESEFQVPAYEHYRDMLAQEADRLDAVAIVTPHTLHYEQARKAIDHSLHVLVEKPMVTEIGHAVDLIEAASEQDVILHVGFQRHFHPGFHEIRRLIESGRIGTVHSVSCHLGQDWIDLQTGRWRTDPSLSGGGQLYDTGGHLLDALLWTTDSIPQTVSAQIDYAEPEIDVNSSITAELDRDGETIIASVGLSGDGLEVEPDEGYVYWGSEGQLTFDGREIVVAEKGAMTYSTEVTENTDFAELNRRKIRNFANAIDGQAQTAPTGETGLQVTAFTEAIYEADRRNETVEVQPLIEAKRDQGD